MMRYSLIIFFCLYSFIANAQTGIGTTTPNASAKLDVSSTNKGFLPPRVSLTGVNDQTTIPSPATGLLVYCKGDAGLASGYYFWNGNAWATIATSGGSGSFASSFLRGSRTASQSLAVGGSVSFSQVDNSSGTAIQLNTSTGQITLAPGNTYRLVANIPNFGGGQRLAFMWYNETTSAYIGSATNAYNPGDNASLGSFGGFAQVIITPNVSTVISFRLLSSLNSANATVAGNGDFSSTGSYPWFEAQVISGNAPVTGQSVDFVSVMLSTDQTNVAVGQNVKFQTIQSGNIPYDPNTGNFSLTAGKTYRLSALASINGTSPNGSAVDLIWRTADGTNIGPLASLISANGSTSFSGQGVVEYIYTPIINTTVSLYIAFVGNSTTALRSNSTNATITQIGSSAIINPWTLSGNDTYNTLGKVGIGTNSPNASSILDITSTNQGLLPPRVALTAKNGTSSPILSPTAGLIIYNTATAGTGGDAVTPGYYFFNGTIWTRMDPEGWSSPVAITIGATTTAPTKGTTTTDYVRYRNVGGKEYEVEYNLVQTAAGTSGSGDYLISLPGSLQFDFTAPGQSAYTGTAGYNAIISRLVNVNGDLYNSGAHNSATVIPYDANRFRIHVNSWGTIGWAFWNSGNYYIGYTTVGFKLIMKFKAQ